MLKIYTLSNCSTCRAATGWLRQRGIAFAERAIRETPPNRAELETMMTLYDGDVRRLFNTSGQDYRAAGLKDKLPGLNRDDALALLAADGRLVRRPFLIGPGLGLVGFDPDVWARALDRLRNAD